MKIEVDVFWVVTLCSIVVGYQSFKGPCCLHLHGGEWPASPPAEKRAPHPQTFSV